MTAIGQRKRPRHKNHTKWSLILELLKQNRLVLLLFVFLAFAGCESTEPDKDNRKELYESKAPGLPIPFTNYRIGGLYRETLVLQSSRDRVKEYVVYGLLAVAGIAFLCVPGGVFAAIYWRWGGGAVLAVVGGLTAIVCTVAAYWFEFMMWVFMGGFLVMVVFGIYAAFSRGGFRCVVNELVGSAQVMKAKDWDENTRSAISQLQSSKTKKEVARFKAENKT